MHGAGGARDDPEPGPCHRLRVLPVSRASAAVRGASEAPVAMVRPSHSVGRTRRRAFPVHPLPSGRTCVLRQSGRIPWPRFLPHSIRASPRSVTCEGRFARIGTPPRAHSRGSTHGQGSVPAESPGNRGRLKRRTVRGRVTRGRWDCGRRGGGAARPALYNSTTVELRCSPTGRPPARSPASNASFD